VLDPHLAYRKTGLGHISTFFGPAMCMFGVFARKDGASQLIDIPKRTSTRFIPPLCFLLACFWVLSRPRGVKNTPKQPAQRSWHSTLIIQCWPYSMSRRTPRFLNAVRTVVCSREHISEPPLDSPPHPYYPLTPPPAHMRESGCLQRMSGMNEWTANLRFNVGSMGSSKDRTNCLVLSHRAEHLSELPRY
jgi:hypothetical protein